MTAKTRLFLVSFVILFFELLCIRWIPSYVRYLSYFSNFILLGAFLGMGVGMLMAGYKKDLFPFFPPAVLLLAIIVRFTKFDLIIKGTDALFFQGSYIRATHVESYWLLPLMFCMTTFLFVLLGQDLGRLIKSCEPLTAYAVNILGSLAGIALYSILAYFWTPPVVWFAVTFGCAILLLPRKQLPFQIACMLAAAGIVFSLARGSLWSPYYRITVAQSAPGDYIINVNNISHQEIKHYDYKEIFYQLPYFIIPGKKFKDVLIIGAGGGVDTAVALAYGAQRVDAVEIDPLIYRLGNALNPDHPYQDSRVHMVIDDGRAFLKKTRKKYDLIIYALTDSLTLTSSFANVRLESFLFSKESFQSAKDHLKPDGMLALYNYYRKPWLIQKIMTMLWSVFHQIPYALSFGGSGRAATLMTGPIFQNHQPIAVDPHADVSVLKFSPFQGRLATDDWPFLYLLTPEISGVYMKSLLLVAFIAVVLVYFARGGGTGKSLEWHFFFLGAAFMVLEVKSIVGFSLLFGSTWLVNALVFFAILLMVLAAIGINAKFNFHGSLALYLLLFASLFAIYFVPGDLLLHEPPWIRYAFASALGFAPIFLANIVFARSFKSAGHADIAFASNLLGAFCGGLLEYLSLVVGYRSLALMALGLYALAMITQDKTARVGAAAPTR